MQLELFDFIDDTVHLFESNMKDYVIVEEKLKELFSSIVGREDMTVSIRTRIKKVDSLKEKMIRNHFYLDYKTPEEALDNLHDLIGITIQCRFIRNELQIYHSLRRHFTSIENQNESQCNYDTKLFLNLRMPQPQLQRNGFTIYRVDGYYMLYQKRINFELQIKSLVHNFWSSIEHEVVYKNPDFIAYDQFNKNMLAAIRDNLDVVDRQLEIMYEEISEESNRRQIGMDDKGFKVFVASSINELVNRRMKESVGFTTDFKKTSAILAQYIYIRDFMNGENNKEKMVDYLEHLNFLSETGIDFTQTIQLERPFQGKYVFSDIVGKYWNEKFNENFQWHVFFTMLFVLQSGDHITAFSDFCDCIRMLLIQPGWYKTTFAHFEDGDLIQNELEEVLAETLVSMDSIRIVHEDMLFQTMSSFKSFVISLEQTLNTEDEYIKQREEIHAQLERRIRKIFQ